MARKRASMREGPLAELFRATEAAQRQQEKADPEREATQLPVEPLEETVEHAPPFEPVAEPPVRVSEPGEAAPGEPGGFSAHDEAPAPEPEPPARPELRPVEELPRIESLPEPAPRL